MSRRVRDHPVVTLSAARWMTKSDVEYTHQSICLLNNQDCLIVVLPKPDSCISSGCTSTHDEDVDLFCLGIGAGSGQSGTQGDTVNQSHGGLGGKSLSAGGITRSNTQLHTPRLYMYPPPISLSLPSFVLFRSRRSHDEQKLPDDTH